METIRLSTFVYPDKLKYMLRRFLNLPRRPECTFFLWGPRQSGKSSLLRASYPDSLWIDLLKNDEFVRYKRHPELLRQELAAEPVRGPVVIDEVQKVPELLDEVHWLIENRGTVFALCGSSARKVRRGHANLLGGRALRHELFGLVSRELGEQFELARALNHGCLPRHYLSPAPRAMLRSYVSDYLKEEIAAEGLVRKLPAFASFLESAALADTGLLNCATVARDCGVSAPAVREYYQILADTLLGRFLPGYVKRPKRKVIQAPKFYFADVGVVNTLARRGRLEPGSELFGKAFESWLDHELQAHRQYSDLFYDLSYWRLASGVEVDFVLNDAEFAIEAKAVARATSDHLKGLRQFREDHPGVRRRILVCLEPRRRKTEDGIDILPWAEFLRELWENNLGME